jgi:hypothetical protein
MDMRRAQGQADILYHQLIRIPPVLEQEQVQLTLSMSRLKNPPLYPLDPGEFSTSFSGELIRDDHD